MTDQSKIIPLSRAKQSAIVSRPASPVIAHFLNREIAAADRLQPASWDDAKRAIDPLLDLALPNGLNVEGVLAGMHASCSTEPLWAIKQTVMDYVTGRRGKGFIPNSAEFGAAVRILTDPIRDEHARSAKGRRDAEAAAEAEQRQPMSDAVRERAARFMENARLIADQERMNLRRPAGPDLSAYYKHQPDAEPAYRPLTAEDVRNVPDAPARKAGLAKIPVPTFDPLPRKA